jgi:hypothetical protein
MLSSARCRKGAHDSARRLSMADTYTAVSTESKSELFFKLQFQTRQTVYRHYIMENSSAVKLIIPRQDMVGAPLFQPNTEAAFSWVQSLPVTSVKSLVQILGQALDELNRTKLSPEVRFNILEVLLPNVEAALPNLARRFLNQPLVMPEEPRRMANFSDSLLAKAATSYTIVAIEAIQQRDAIREINPARLTCQAIQRALVFSGRRVLQRLQLHQPMEVHSWHSLHQLYVLAESQGLADLQVPEPLSGGNTIKATYLQTLILGCCKPNQLRHTELAALYRGLQQWNELVHLHGQSTQKHLFLVNLENDQPAQYRALSKDRQDTHCRYLDTSELVEHLQKIRAETGAEGVQFDKNTHVPSAMLDHLIASLDSMSLRSYKRASSEGSLSICVGLSSIHYQVARQRKFGQLLQNNPAALAMSTTTPDNPFMSALNRGDVWPKPNPEKGEFKHDVEHDIHLDESTRARLVLEDTDQLDTHQRYPVFNVQLADTSPGGYCLEWAEELPGDIKTGDLVGLKEDMEQRDWVIAVIRWLSRLENAKTLIGLELLSPRAIAYGASIHQKDGEKTQPMRALLLPEIKLVGHPHTLITPRAGFKERQKVTILNSAESRTVQLRRHVASTGSYAQFEFQYVKELGDVLAERPQGQKVADFDSVWSNI